VRKGHVPSSIRTAPATTHILKACGNGLACQRDIYTKVSGHCSRHVQSDYQCAGGGMVARARRKFQSIINFFVKLQEFSRPALLFQGFRTGRHIRTSAPPDRS
jgi:hypothetical protein